MAFLKKANILAFLKKIQNIVFFQIKSQIFDFKSAGIPDPKRPDIFQPLTSDSDHVHGGFLKLD